MEAIVRFFVRRHLLVNVIALAMVVLGLMTANNTQREFIPSFPMPLIWVTATLPGASAEDIETKVTIPIEEALEEIEGLDATHTMISDNLSFTTVDLLPDYSREEIIASETDIRQAIDGITDFPVEMDDEPIIMRLNPARSIVVEVALTGPSGALDSAAELLEKLLERNSLISKVDTLGLQDREVRVMVDPASARAHGITLNDIISAIDKRNVSSTGGNLESSSNQRQVVMWSRYEKAEDVADTVLKFSPEGGAIRIADLAQIETGREDTGLRIRADGQRSIILQVFKREKADIIDAVDAVREALLQTRLPQGVETHLTRDESYIIDNRLSIMAVNGLLGALLVAVVLFYFVRLQPAIWVLCGIPIVFLGSLAVFGQFDLTLNMMSLTAFVIVLGMIVDDAVVVSERIAFKQAQGLPSEEAAVRGTMEMMQPVTAAALTTILAFAPMIAIGGTPGKITWQLPAVVVMALFVSVIESFFVLPAHMSTIKAGANLSKRAAIVALEHRYRNVLGFLLTHRAIVLLIALGAFVFIMGVIRPNVPFILFPQDDATRLYVKVSAPAGTSLEETEAFTVNLEQQITGLVGEDLELLMTRVGHQNNLSPDKDRGEASNEALLIASMKQSDRKHNNAEWIQILQENMTIPKGLNVIIQSDYFGPPTDQPVTIHILANDDEMRRGVAHEVASYLRAQEGVIEIDIDERPGTPKIDLVLDYERLALHGLDPKSVGQMVSAAFFGIEATEHRDVSDTTKIRVQFDKSARADVNALLDMPIRNARGELLTLREFVTPRERHGSTRLYHRDGFRSATVRASFAPDADRTALEFAAQIESELFPRFDQFSEMIIFNGGEAKETKKTAGGLQRAAILAVSGIAVVIWIMLGSLLETLFVMLVVPFAFAGVFFVFYLHDLPLSMFAMTGALGLAGVVVNAAIVMLDSVQKRVSALGEVSELEAENALKDAVCERLRPILVTTLTTLGGVLPTAYGIGGYDPIIGPMSLAIGWGLAISTLVTLFVVPILYTTARDTQRLLGLRSTL